MFSKLYGLDDVEYCVNIQVLNMLLKVYMSVQWNILVYLYKVAHSAKYSWIY